MGRPSGGERDADRASRSGAFHARVDAGEKAGRTPRYEWSAGLRDGDPVLRITLRGEIDMAAEARIWPELGERLEDCPSFVLLDLSDVTFLDSTGLRLLLRISQRVADTSCRLLLARPSAAVRKLLDLSGLAREFEYLDDDDGRSWCPVCGVDIEASAARCAECGSIF